MKAPSKKHCLSEDGAFKVAIDTTISEYPILEWYPGERVEFVYQRDRIREIVFKTPYKEKGKVYVLNERYGYGYIINELYLDNKLVDIKSIKATENLTDITFDESIMLAEPFMIYESADMRAEAAVYLMASSTAMIHWMKHGPSGWMH